MTSTVIDLTIISDRKLKELRRWVVKWQHNGGGYRAMLKEIDQELTRRDPFYSPPENN